MNALHSERLESHPINASLCTRHRGQEEGGVSLVRFQLMMSARRKKRKSPGGWAELIISTEAMWREIRHPHFKYFLYACLCFKVFLSNFNSIFGNMGRYRPGLPTMSLGHGAAGYSMPVKLAAIAEIGFEGVEVSFVRSQCTSKILNMDPRSSMDVSKLMPKS